MALSTMWRSAIRRLAPSPRTQTGAADAGGPPTQAGIDGQHHSAAVAPGASADSRSWSIARSSRRCHCVGRGFGLGGGQQLLDQRQLTPGVALDDLEAAIDLLRRRAARHAQQLRPAQDRVEGRPELVRDRGQELLLHAAGVGAGRGAWTDVVPSRRRCRPQEAEQAERGDVGAGRRALDAAMRSSRRPRPAQVSVAA